MITIKRGKGGVMLTIGRFWFSVSDQYDDQYGTMPMIWTFGFGEGTFAPQINISWPIR